MIGKPQNSPVGKTFIPDQIEYIIDSWNTEKGLPVNGVNTVTQTKDGYLWLGSEEGLVRYNGSDFVVFNSKNNPAFKDSFITSLYSGNSDTLWIGTRLGTLIRYSDKKFKGYTLPEVNNKQISAIVDDKKGNVWLGGIETGLIKFDGEKTKLYTIKDGLVNNDIKCFSLDSKGGIWIGTVDGLSYFKAGKFINYSGLNGAVNNNIRSIYKILT